MISIFTSKIFWNFFDKISADKIWYKKDKEIKVSHIMPIRVKRWTIWVIISIRSNARTILQAGHGSQRAPTILQANQKQHRFRFFPPFFRYGIIHWKWWVLRLMYAFTFYSVTFWATNSLPIWSRDSGFFYSKGSIFSHRFMIKFTDIWLAGFSFHPIVNICSVVYE